jgi:hypothetical protein
MRSDVSMGSVTDGGVIVVVVKLAVGVGTSNIEYQYIELYRRRWGQGMSHQEWDGKMNQVKYYLR